MVEVLPVRPAFRMDFCGFIGTLLSTQQALALLEFTVQLYFRSKLLWKRGSVQHCILIRPVLASQCRLRSVRIHRPWSEHDLQDRHACVQLQIQSAVVSIISNMFCECSWCLSNIIEILPEYVLFRLNFRLFFVRKFKCGKYLILVRRQFILHNYFRHFETICKMEGRKG